MLLEPVWTYHHYRDDDDDDDDHALDHGVRNNYRDDACHRVDVDQ